jgi:hypothetical protein
MIFNLTEKNTIAKLLDMHTCNLILIILSYIQFNTEEYLEQKLHVYKKLGYLCIE